MARKKKEDKPMTQQVRIYERDAQLIRLILATRERGKTFADIVHEAMEKAFNVGQTDDVVRQIEGIAEEAVQPKRRNVKG